MSSTEIKLWTVQENPHAIPVLRDSDLHTYKINININNCRFGLNQESVTDNFLTSSKLGSPKYHRSPTSDPCSLRCKEQITYNTQAGCARFPPCSAEMLLISSEEWWLWLPESDGTWRKDSPWSTGGEATPPSCITPDVGLPDVNGSCTSSITGCPFTIKLLKEVPSTQSSHFTTSNHSPTTPSLCSQTSYSINRNI